MAKKKHVDDTPPIDTYFTLDEDSLFSGFATYWIAHTLQESKGRVDVVTFTSKKKADQKAIVVTREPNTPREVISAWLNKNHFEMGG